jgi:hypothetical protein
MEGSSQNLILGGSVEIFRYSCYSNRGQNLTKTVDSSYERQHAFPRVSTTDAYRSVSATAAERKNKMDALRARNL